MYSAASSSELMADSAQIILRATSPSAAEPLRAGRRGRPRYLRGPARFFAERRYGTGCPQATHPQASLRECAVLGLSLFPRLSDFTPSVRHPPNHYLDGFGTVLRSV